MALLDLFKLTLFSELFGQDIVNVFHYQQLAANNTQPALNLLNTWQTTVLPKIALCNTDDITYKRILSQNLTNPADNAEDTTPTPFAGTLSAFQAAPSFIAASFRSSRPDLSKRYSYKRFAGCPEDWIEGNIWNQTAVNTPFGDLAAAMTAPLGGAYSFTPAQVVNTADTGDPPVWVMRYLITSWVDQEEISSQLSRRAGRGD